MKKILVFLFAIGWSFSSVGQKDLSFYHFGASTPQSSSFNPSYFPDARFYLSLPVISGVSVDVNAGLSYDDIFSEIPNTDSVRFDIRKALSSLTEGDRIRNDGTLSIFQLGFRVGKGTAISLFANDRYKTSAFYPTSTLDYLSSGNGRFLDETVEEGYLSASGIYYREMGIGVVQKINISETKKLTIGVRGKYLQGIFQAQTNPNASVSFLTDSEDYNLRMTFTNPEIRTAGLDRIEGDSIGYFLENDNAGYGFDVGLEFELSKKLSIGLAVNDIGRITWTQNVQNYSLTNNVVDLPDIDFDDFSNASTFLADTLEVLFSDELDSISYSTPLSTRSLASVKYRILPKGTITATAFMENEYHEKILIYGLGYTHEFGKMLTLSASGTYNERHGFNVGGGFMARFGIMQLYMNVDSFGDAFAVQDAAQVKSMNLRFGMNFLFGRAEKKEKKQKVKKVKEEVSPFPEEYDLEHIKDIEE
ncbi:MAG: hypothetical protein JXR07_05180 [Reichenbachiella sp.]